MGFFFVLFCLEGGETGQGDVKSFSSCCWLAVLFTFVSAAPLPCLGPTAGQSPSNYLSQPVQPFNSAGAVVDFLPSFGVFSVSWDVLEINNGVLPGISNSWDLTGLFLGGLLHLHSRCEVARKYPSTLFLKTVILTVPCIHEDSYKQHMLAFLFE